MDIKNISDSTVLDNIFLKYYPVHPLVAFFFFFPFKQEHLFNPYPPLQFRHAFSNDKYHFSIRLFGDGGLTIRFSPFFIPYGMAARRVLLNIFSRNFNFTGENRVLRFGETKKQILRQLGYNFAISPMGKLGGLDALAVFSVYPIEMCFEGKRPIFDEEIVGKEKERLAIDEFFTESEQDIWDALGSFYLINTAPYPGRLVSKCDHSYESCFHEISTLSRSYFESCGVKDFEVIENCGDKGLGVDLKWLEINTHIPFKLSFPVDFSKVVENDHGNEFWNVYVFLVDVLPRVKKRRKEPILWEKMYDLFQREARYRSLADFKYQFKKTLKKVYSIYPQAEGRVITSDKKYLVCKYAPPPI